MTIMTFSVILYGHFIKTRFLSGSSCTVLVQRRLVHQSVLKSYDGNNTAVLFVNKTETDTTYYWMNADGNESHRGRAAANAFSIHHTHAGHI